MPALLDFIPQATPKWSAPHHLMPAVSKLQAFQEQPFDFVFSVPPRHGKTELILHFIVWALLKDPSLNILYVTYAAGQAKVKSKRALKIARSAGLKLVKATADTWSTPANEMVFWTSIGGQLTGKGFDIIIVDDPVENRVQAESLTYRERVWDMYQSDLQSRLEPGGSFICIQTRWHEDDLAGRLTRINAANDDEEEGFEPLEYINIPAIIDEGTPDERALWPERWPLPVMKARRRKAGPYGWSSLYQGRPRPRGSTVFGEPTFYQALPFQYRAAQGLDLSYTEKTSSDWSVLATMLEWEQTMYVKKVFRAQKRAPDFKDDLRRERMAGTRCRIYAAGVELGAVDFLRKADHGPSGKPVPGMNIEALAPRGDKFTRAIDFAAAWNEGRVLVPSPELVAARPIEYEWVNRFLDELKSFTGVKDKQDDQVDAAVAAFDVLNQPAQRRPTAKAPLAAKRGGEPSPTGRRM